MICSACSTEVRAGTAFCPNCGARIADPFIGATLLDRYRIEAKIATGGFGGIYRGIQLTTGRKVAVKVMHEELCTDSSLVARFRREGVVLCNLRDAHTVTTFEVGETDDGRLFIVMELLEGQTLLDVLRSSGAMPWTRMLAITRAICSSLAEAHALGVVHRDLKPGNIFLEHRGQDDFVKVLDFGIAKITQGSGLDGNTDLTRMGQAVGTLEYMAPEQLMGGKTDIRTDIYMLGVLMYEMIAGRRPFSDALGTDLLTAQLTQHPVPLIDRIGVPPDVDRIVLRCLAQDGVERYPNVTALANDIASVLESPEFKPPPASIELARDTVFAPHGDSMLAMPDPARPTPAPAPPPPSPPTVRPTRAPVRAPTPIPERIPRLSRSTRQVLLLLLAGVGAIALGAALAILAG